MSDYTYTDHTGDTLRLLTSFTSPRVILIAKGDQDCKEIHIASEDAPTVAAELLKAAGQESAIVAKSKSEVVERPFGQIRCGKVTVHADVDYASLLTTAADYIAIAEWAKGKLAEAQANADKEAEAEKKLQERRDELASDLSMGAYSYKAITPMVKFAIDRIIELEDGK